MFSNYSVEEKMLVCALVKNLFQESSKGAFGIDHTLLKMTGKMTPALSQFLTLSQAYLHATGLGEDMITNAQISMYVWENMSLDKQRTFLFAMFQFLELPDIRKNMALMGGIACALTETLRKIDGSIVCNPYTGEFFCDKYGIHTDPILYDL